MDARRPPPLARLLDGRDAEVRAEAWHDFLEEYSDLVLQAVASFGRDYDAKMDRYRFVLESLRKDDYRRLRSYRVREGSTFRGWLVVVIRRLCLDFERARYGRGGRSSAADEEQERAARRRIVDMAGVALDPALLPQSGRHDPEYRLRASELRRALERVLGSLEPRDRLLLKLRFEDDLSIRQVADVMSFPTVFHVYRRLRSVLEEVRRRLGEGGVDDARP